MITPFHKTGKIILLVSIFFMFGFGVSAANAQADKPKFKVIAFYTGREDKAHISFMHEAHKWFLKMATQYHFQYDSTKDWDNMNAEFLSHYQVVVFLDTRPTYLRSV